MSTETALIYIGKGASLDNIPARDLTVEEVERFGGAAALLASGLYSTTPAVIAEKSEAEAQSDLPVVVKSKFSKRDAQSDRSAKEN